MVSHNSNCMLREKKRKEPKNFLDSNPENVLNYLCFAFLKDLLDFLVHKPNCITK